MKIGLFFGSFNPVHNGHLAIAGYMAEFIDLEEVWLVVSPQNPLKPAASLLEDYHRFKLVVRAIENGKKIKACDAELSLPKPSYTIQTLSYMHEKYPHHDFAVIMGSDALETFKQWKDWEKILGSHEIYIYPRTSSDGGALKNHPKVKCVPAPLVEISATVIRNYLKEKKDVRSMLPEAVYNYIIEKHFYET